MYTLPDDYYQPKEEFLTKAESLLKGLRLYDFPGYASFYWSNTSNCMHNLTNLTWTSFPMLLTYVQQDSPDGWSKYTMSTLWLQWVAKGLFTCNDMAKNMYTDIAERVALFSYSWTMFTYGFL